jgi:hypothetical protein
MIDSASLKVNADENWIRYDDGINFLSLTHFTKDLKIFPCPN